MKTINQRSKRDWNIFDATMVAEGVEEANTDETIEAWSLLISSGSAWTLQGFFGRNATTLIEQEYLQKDGMINWEKIDEMRS